MTETIAFMPTRTDQQQLEELVDLPAHIYPTIGVTVTASATSSDCSRRRRHRILAQRPHEIKNRGLDWVDTLCKDLRPV